MKKLCMVAALLFSVLLLTGCFCSHEFAPATCTSPAICSKCEKEDPNSKPLGHSWQDADCVTPKTCANCGLTDGEPLGHSWRDANCTKPETCTACKLTRGEPLGHRMQDATCTKAAACSVCGAKEGKALGHEYVDNVCVRCQDKMIETHSDLHSYLKKECRKLTTAIGTVSNLTFDIVVNEPNYWHSHDFEIRIESTLWCKDVDTTIDYAVMHGDFLPYEDRVQAVADVLDYQYKIVKAAEAAFPGQKFEVKFYTWGYEYPNIKVGFNDESLLIWRNWKYSGSGSGYAGTKLVDWTVVNGDFLPFSSYEDLQLREKIVKDVRRLRPEYAYD